MDNQTYRNIIEIIENRIAHFNMELTPHDAEIWFAGYKQANDEIVGIIKELSQR